MVPLELVGVRVEVPANTPMLLLREATGRHRLMPIYIGTPEATAIHYALEGVESPRPLTHDLFVQTLAELGVELEREPTERALDVVGIRTIVDAEDRVVVRIGVRRAHWLPGPASIAS